MGLTERITVGTDIRHVEGDIPVEFIYTAGAAGERFFRALKEQGKILGTTCPECGHTYVPLRTYCERCLIRLKDEVTVGPGGEIVSLTLAAQDVDGRPLREPVAYALVRLDGATGVMVHRLLVEDEMTVGIHDRVTAVLKPKAKRTGSILDIEGFRVVPTKP